MKKLKMDEGVTTQSTTPPGVRQGKQADVRQGKQAEGGGDDSSEDDVQDSWEALAGDGVC